MKSRTFFFAVYFVVTATNLSYPGSKDFRYISPVPGSSFVSKQSNIILHAAERIASGSSLDGSVLTVTGSRSGNHTGKLIVADDAKTLVFKPSRPFAAGEVVRVHLLSTLRDVKGNEIQPMSFQFAITSNEQASHVLTEFDQERLLNGTQSGAPSHPKVSSQLQRATKNSLPPIDVTIVNKPSPGYIFICNFPFNANIPNTPYLMMLDNGGKAVFAREMPVRCHDFKLQPNGLFTYYDSYLGHFSGLNSSFQLVDSFQCGNGYSTDEHELRILPHGHALLMSYDRQIVRMDTIVPGGQPNAQVVGLIIQELDQAKNVVFQWRSWDHFQITDATHENLTASYIDYVHGNALELDNDGNILLSSRHMDEITKINRATGEIMWRWGGKHNDFTFTTDTLQFSHQHAVRRLPNGHITLFDNGNFHTPHFSRAVEYDLDEVNKTAALVWSYRDTAGTYGFAMGYVQRLGSGNTLIGWGSTSPTITEVRPNGQKAFEMKLPQGIFSYRAYRFDFNLADVEPKNGTEFPSHYTLGQNYPNPFNPITTIGFSLPASGYVSLDVFNILGEKIESLVAQTLTEGSHNAQWNAAQYPSGVYFYQLRAGNFAETKKLMLLR